MLKWPLSSIIILLLLAALTGCGPFGQSGPPSTDTSSSSIPALADRIEFLQTYLTFKRQFEKLEFNINYKNNGGGLIPGRSDWDIRLVAKVPAHELPLWTDGLNSSTENGQWVSETAREIDVSGVDSWYRGDRKVVGIDQKNSIVVYRLNSFGF